MPIWDDVITEQDRIVYEHAGWHKPAGYGKRPALLVLTNLSICPVLSNSSLIFLTGSVHSGWLITIASGHFCFAPFMSSTVMQTCVVQ